VTKTGSQVSLSLVASQMPSWLLPAVAGGVLMGLSAPPAALPITIVPGLLLLLRSMRRIQSHQNPALPVFVSIGLSWGLAYAWVGTHVMPHVAWTSVLVLVALVSVMAASATAGYRTAGTVGMTVGLLAAEMVLTYGPVAFPWVSPGFTVSGTILDVLPMWSGITGTSALLLAFAVGMEAILYTRMPARTLDATLVTVMVFFALGVSFLPERGSEPQRSIQPAGPTTTTHATLPHLRVALIQPGMTPWEWADIHDAARTTQLSRLSMDADEAPLHVWPETALPQRMAESIPLLSHHFLVPPGAALVTGAIIQPKERTDRPYNASVFIPAEGAPSWNAKRKLVPFAEYVPGEYHFPFLGFLRVRAGGVSGYASGQERPQYDVDGVPFATLICFESVFAREARSAVRSGAGFLVVQTQDGWWTSDRAWMQHQALSSLVASAVGRPMAVASVSGWTGLIGSDGHTRGDIAPGVPGTLVVEVHPETASTGYFHAGEWPAVGIFLLLSTCALVSRYRDPTFRTVRTRVHQSS